MMTIGTRGSRLAWVPVFAGCLSLSALSSAHADTLLDQGKQIYTQGANGAPACIACHGAQGEGSTAANFPYLAGQGADYLREQLAALADGTRQSAVMKPIASALDDAQRQARRPAIHATARQRPA
ncbi:c-type cytochrome [Castellaniella caeni]